MTAMNWILEKDRLTIAADTLSLYASDRSPYRYMNKIFILPHLNMVLSGIGNSQVILNYFNFLNTSLIARNADFLNNEVTNLLRKFQNDYSGAGNTTVYHFSVNEISGFVEGRTFSNTQDFIPEIMNYDHYYIHPTISTEVTTEIINRNLETDEFFIELIKKQREWDLQQPQDQRIGIGGEIQRVFMQDKNILYSTIYRFEDYISNYEKMIKNIKI